MSAARRARGRQEAPRVDHGSITPEIEGIPWEIGFAGQRISVRRQSIFAAVLVGGIDEVFE
jgi:hypothetical protein